MSVHPELADSIDQMQAYNRAVVHQRKANLWTGLRNVSPHILAPATMVFGPTWMGFADSVLADASDLFDGDQARKAEAQFEAVGLTMPDPFEGKTKNQRGRMDDRADKKHVFGKMLSEAVDDVREQAYVSAGVTAIAGLALFLRDRKMAQYRIEGNAQGKNTNAIPINKKAQVVINAATTLGQAPLAKNRAGRIIRNTGIVIGTGLKVYGLFKFKESMAAQPDTTGASDGRNILHPDFNRPEVLDGTSEALLLADEPIDAQ